MVLWFPKHLFHPCVLLDNNRITHQILYHRMNTNLRNAFKATLNWVAELQTKEIILWFMKRIDKLEKENKKLKQKLNQEEQEIFEEESFKEDDIKFNKEAIIIGKEEFFDPFTSILPFNNLFPLIFSI